MGQCPVVELHKVGQLPRALPLLVLLDVRGILQPIICIRFGFEMIPTYPLILPILSVYVVHSLPLFGIVAKSSSFQNAKLNINVMKRYDM